MTHQAEPTRLITVSVALDGLFTEQQVRDLLSAFPGMIREISVAEEGEPESPFGGHLMNAHGVVYDDRVKLVEASLSRSEGAEDGFRMTSDAASEADLKKLGYGLSGEAGS